MRNWALHRSQCLSALSWVLALPLLKGVAWNAGCMSSLGTLEVVLLLCCSPAPLLRPEHSARDALCPGLSLQQASACHPYSTSCTHVAG